MPRISGRSAFLQLLVDEGVTHLFGNPGTTELPIMEVVPDFPQLKFVLGLQESIVLGMADGYCRASHRLAAANVHVMPGLGNAMGALYNAKFSGSPVILTAGQQEQGHGLLEPLLYEPLVPVAQPLVKWAVEVTRAADLPRILHRAAKIALTPPTGPVFLSLPGDVLDETLEMDMGRPVRVVGSTRPSDETLARFAELLLGARRPVILAGHELARHDAFAEAAELAELLGARCSATPIPYSAPFPTEHPAYMGALSRQQKQVRALLEPYDLLICLGADLLRMSVYSPVEPLPAGLPVIHVSERAHELGKNYRTDLAVHANVKETLKALLPMLKDLPARKPKTRRTEEEQLDRPARPVACGSAARGGNLADRSAVPDAALRRGAARRRGRGRRGPGQHHQLAEVPPAARHAVVLRPRERWPRLRGAGRRRHQPRAAGPAGRGDRRRRQRDVRRPGPVDRGAREAAHHLRDRQQPQLPHHQGAAGRRFARPTSSPAWTFASRTSTSWPSGTSFGLQSTESPTRTTSRRRCAQRSPAAGRT